jgi:hypothetical protein
MVSDIEVLRIRLALLEAERDRLLGVLAAARQYKSRLPLHLAAQIDIALKTSEPD